MLLSELMTIRTDEDNGSVISLSRKANHVGVLLSCDGNSPCKDVFVNTWC